MSPHAKAMALALLLIGCDPEPDPDFLRACEEGAKVWCRSGTWKFHRMTTFGEVLHGPYQCLCAGGPGDKLSAPGFIKR